MDVDVEGEPGGLPAGSIAAITSRISPEPPASASRPESRSRAHSLFLIVVQAVAGSNPVVHPS
jgi:hypothetical protein